MAAARKDEAQGQGLHDLLDRLRQTAEAGECPIPELDEAPEEQMAAAEVAVGMQEHTPARGDAPGDHLTPRTMIGGHRDGRWISDPDEPPH